MSSPMDDRQKEPTQCHYCGDALDPNGNWQDVGGANWAHFPECPVPSRAVPDEEPRFDIDTYGDLPDAIRPMIVGHEWDNMTRAEQRVWLIEQLSALRSESEAVKAERATAIEAMLKTLHESSSDYEAALESARSESEALRRDKERQSIGATMIAAERTRQVSGEGWTPAHDDEHTRGEMAITAACYAANGTDAEVTVMGEDAFPWGSWHDKRKKHDRIRQLVIAGALIAAEIDRLTRANGQYDEKPKPRHVCGLSGFGLEAGDVCDACQKAIPSSVVKDVSSDDLRRSTLGIEGTNT